MREINCLFDNKKRSKEDDFPYSAVIEILAKCKINREYCYCPSYVKEMDYKTITCIIDQLYELGIIEITLTGAEVGIHSSFIKVVRYIRDKGIKLEIMSNASLFSKELMDELSELEVFVSTSLFSEDSKINESITKSKLSSSRILENVLYMKEKGIQVEVKVPVLKRSYIEYARIDEVCKNHNIRIIYSVSISPRIEGDDKTFEFALCQDELNLFIGCNNKKTNKIFSDYKENDYICSAISNNLGIEVNGDVFPCKYFHYKYGNIYENSLKEIWYEMPARKKLLSIKKSDIQGCVACKLNNICVRCPGLAYSGDENFGKCSEWNRMIAMAKLESLENKKI